MMGKMAVEVYNVDVFIKQKPILQGITLTVEQGEFVGIIGPNGAGKSTLLRSICGICPIASGQIRILDQPITSFRSKQMARTVAYMQQEVNAGFGFSALEVVLAGRYPYLSWWQNEREEDYRIARKYMAFTGVESLAEKSLQQVSGGERQRIFLAKVLAQETPLVFLDEPTASLDLVYQEEIFRYCQTLSNQGKTILIIAHDIKLAAKFCSRLVLLAEGKIIAGGTPIEVLTVENLQESYGLHSAVFLNKITGNLDIHTYAAAGVTNKERFHIIGGGGSTGDIIRLLHEKAYNLSGGVFQQGDTDADIARAFDVEYIAGPAFCAIDENLSNQNRNKIIEADLTVLTNLCYGEQNLDNLKAAFMASRLVVIEDTPIEERDFTGGKAIKLYRDLVKLPQVKVVTSAQFIATVAASSDISYFKDNPI